MRGLARAGLRAFGHDTASCIGLLFVTALMAALASAPSRADQGGISFWLPGAFGSLAATPVREGYNVWLTFASSQSAAEHLAAKPVIRK